MEPITLEQLQQLFKGLRDETDWNVDGELLWGYFFTSPSIEKLEAAAEALEATGVSVVGIYQSEEEEDEAQEGYILRIEKLEIHTPESLYARNQQYEAFALEYELESYDGMDVNPPGGEEDEEADLDEDGEWEELEELDGAAAPENTALAQALEAFEERAEDDTLAALLEALKEAVFIVPIPLDQEESEQDEEGFDIVQFLICLDEEEREFLPLFTDLDSLRSWTSDPVQAINLAAAEAWQFILDQPSCHGAVINPAGSSFTLTREKLEALLKDWSR